jgi:ABC-2 type transport system ATP-binding protein
VTDAIRAEGLSKGYRTLRAWRTPRMALRDLSFHVPAGGITGLLGPNGAGKTTIARLLLGLVRASAGSAHVLGRDVRRESLAVRREVGFVPQERAIFGRMRVPDFVAGVRSLSPGWDAAVAARLARRWRIDDGARLRELSPGTRGCLLLLVALARRAPLLVLDEPTAGLDPATVEDVLSELAGAAADGATLLLVTHRLEEVERICDRVVVMNRGRAVLQEDLDELRAGWRVIDVAGHPAPERLRTWAEVAGVAPHGEHVRLHVRAAPDAVVERLRLVGAEVTAVRPLTLREIYLAATRGDDADATSDAARDDLA